MSFELNQMRANGNTASNKNSAAMDAEIVIHKTSHGLLGQNVKYSAQFSLYTLP